MTELPFLTISRLAALIKGREISPVDVVNAYLERIDRLDSQLNAFITLMRDDALEGARQAESDIASGNYKGPLHGIPIGLKDLYYTKGVRTTGGSKIKKWAEFVPDEDATVVTRFKEQGAIIIGKLNMHEFAAGGTTTNPHYGPARNPWNLEHIPGGSSGGSGAAIAASLCAGTLGSDTGGSIRGPSSFCGIVGLKPTYGRVSRFGVIPLAWTLDHVGPMTKTVEDTALIMNVISGYDPRDAASANVPVPDFTERLNDGVQGLRIGIPKEFFFDEVNTDILEAVHKAIEVLKKLGATTVEVSLPNVDKVPRFHSFISMSEAAAYHTDLIRENADEISPDVRQRFEGGQMTMAVHYIRAQRLRALVSGEIHRALEQADVLLTPTSSTTAPRINAEAGGVMTIANFTAPFNQAGVPACSVPCGFDSNGLPIGLQIAGRDFGDATVLRVAHAYEQATDWHTRRPNL